MDSFCFIVGSFATTAPEFRSPTSDIDILVSEDLYDQEDVVIDLILAKFPNINADREIDLNVRIPDASNKIYFHISHWQSPENFISLKPTTVELICTRTDRNIQNCLRNPDKTDFIDYLQTSSTLSFYKLGGLKKAIEHYGSVEFWKVVDASKIGDLMQSIVRSSKNPEYQSITILVGNIR